MSWQFREAEFTDPADWTGFVYVITHAASGRRYVGKKLLTRTNTRQVRGRRRRFRTESDWRTYWGSNSELQELVQQQSAQGFERRIIHLAQGRGVLGYLEASLQFRLRVLERPAEFFNGIINCRVNARHLKSLDQVLTDTAWIAANSLPNNEKT